MGTPSAMVWQVFDIPDFTISGVLPPYLGPTPLNPALMAPFNTSLTRIAGRLCESPERKEVFRGLLNYRQQINGVGLRIGFQWLSGSFMEDIERIESRNPQDVDVVTFCHRPSGIVDDLQWQSFVSAHLHLIDPGATKAAFKCDAYFVDLDAHPFDVVNLTRYWFGLFSHRRGGLWKGMLQVGLPITADDADASQIVGP